MRRFLAFVGTLSAMALTASAADARTWYVKPDSTGDAPTIRAAMDSAQAGDEVLLASGRYTTTSQGAASPWYMIHMKADITLCSQAGPENTILDAQGQTGVLSCSGVGEHRIEGLTITGGISVGGSSGAGIFSPSDSDLTISNCIVRNNQAEEEGGGIYCKGATITNCQILDNRAGFFQGRGGGVHSEDSEISGCIIRGNVASAVEISGSGGGIYDAGSTVISDCWIEDNVSDGGGGVAGGATIRRCIFVANKAGPSLNSGGAGGAVISGGAIEDCIFVRNEARGGSLKSGRGGAIYAYGLSATISRCTLIANSADGDASAVGGIYHEGFGGTAAVSSTIIARTQGLACAGSLTFTCCDLFGNVLGDSICGSDGGGNFSADPEFCAVDPVASLNFGIQSDSPCAPGNHPDGTSCGLIGAVPVGCEAVSMEEKTWSLMKSLWRE